MEIHFEKFFISFTTILGMALGVEYVGKDPEIGLDDNSVVIDMLILRMVVCW